MIKVYHGLGPWKGSNQPLALGHDPNGDGAARLSPRPLHSPRPMQSPSGSRGKGEYPTSFHQFIDENYHISSVEKLSDVVPVSEVDEEYRNWCKDSNGKHKKGAVTGEMLRNMGIIPGELAGTELAYYQTQFKFRPTVLLNTLPSDVGKVAVHLGLNFALCAFTLLAALYLEVADGKVG